MDENQLHIEPPTRKEADQMWENILSGIRQREREKKNKRKMYFLVAASLAILFALGSIFGYNHYKRPDIYTSVQATTKIILADSTEVTLLKGAELTVEKTFPTDTREVFLKGDALFKVSKSKEHPFIVHGNGYETKVLGTVFKVSQIGKAFKVDLFEGKVLVYRKGKPKENVSLKPQQTFTNYGIPQASAVIQTDKPKTDRHRDRLASLTFTQCQLKNVVRVIEDSYGIKVIYPTELGNTIITVSSPDTTADNFIKILAIQLNLNTRQKNDSTFELEE